MKCDVHFQIANSKMYTKLETLPDRELSVFPLGKEDKESIRLGVLINYTLKMEAASCSGQPPFTTLSLGGSNESLSYLGRFTPATEPQFLWDRLLDGPQNGSEYCGGKHIHPSRESILVALSLSWSDMSSSAILVSSDTAASFAASILFVAVHVQSTSYRICNHFHYLCLYVFRSRRLSVSTFKHKAIYGSRAAVILFSFN